ncbi:adenine(58)-N(1)-methyltransferase non-catalytic subunit TRM6 [Dunaliella salina]|uniref:tRNA (adenine(58)-N(1))-methyltransferase non-catalytic subunit TRM6 n=1 Tax=Dunaliella salina TaxID=3046 RepID=A0ABQ7FXC4_DUNSA|nr:adenine(58)-N(1)-methyltransferase non-catalytic subunit TRM6 [Dunaliella salina]|eukprot:KAF5827016.1 adenine(58)-N(1)-methyltransferase non-catalytic subunit TRM6 [Dunaliella salina]
MALIQEGNTVVLDENGEKKSFVKLKKKGSARIGKSQLSTDPFLGSPFGAVFSLSADGKSMQRVTECPTGEWATQHNISTMRNNAELFDRNTANQKLTDADIAAMRASGKEGAEIVEALISNSATFESKTEFSQEKYRKKKTKKYVINVTLRRPTALTICQAYFEKGPARVFNLRPDSLAIMLSLANLSAGAKVLVMDACVGVVAAAVVERLGGFGHVCCVHADKPMSTDCVRLLNLSPQQASVQCSASLAALHEAKQASVHCSPSLAALHKAKNFLHDAICAALCALAREA